MQVDLVRVRVRVRVRAKVRVRARVRVRVAWVRALTHDLRVREVKLDERMRAAERRREGHRPLLLTWLGLGLGLG